MNQLFKQFPFSLSMPDFNTRPVPIRPADLLLANLVHTFPNIIFKYHIHDSLLENKPEEDLSEEEKREAWLEYDKQMHQETGKKIMLRLDDTRRLVNMNFTRKIS